MDRMRGAVMLAMGGFALVRGWQIHGGRGAVLAYGLGVVSIALGVWRVTRGTGRPAA